MVERPKRISFNPSPQVTGPEEVNVEHRVDVHPSKWPYGTDHNHNIRPNPNLAEDEARIGFQALLAVEIPVENQWHEPLSTIYSGTLVREMGVPMSFMVCPHYLDPVGCSRLFEVPPAPELRIPANNQGIERWADGKRPSDGTPAPIPPPPALNLDLNNVIPKTLTINVTAWDVGSFIRTKSTVDHTNLTATIEVHDENAP